MTNRYALADYQVVIRVPEGIDGIGGTNIVIGGPGDYAFGQSENSSFKGFIGQVSVSRSDDAWSTEGDVTGSWVHNQSLSKVGTCAIDITQISEAIIKLSQVSTIFEGIQDDVLSSRQINEGLDITVQSIAESMPVAHCEDCYIQKHPDQTFGETAEKQSWVFTSGRVTFYN